MAITREQKRQAVAQYQQWISQSRAVILTEYKGLTMKQIDELRGKLREAGGEFHVVKNSLGKLAFKQANLPLPEGFFEGSTAVGFTFGDAPLLAKTIAEFARSTEALKIKGGYLGNQAISAAEITALAEMPPLPVMRARLMGTILAPAAQLARLLAEPARQVAAALKAYAEKEAVPEAA